MAVNIGHIGTGEPEIAEMNITPLIDVMLVLLVMLIVILPIQMHAVKLDMPAKGVSAQQPATVDLHFDFDGRITWNGRTIDAAAMDGYLYRIGAERSGNQPEIRITADRLARYDAVAKAMADAQRSGVKHIAILGTERFSQP